MMPMAPELGSRFRGSWKNSMVFLSTFAIGGDNSIDARLRGRTD
jgi:hypothetical protein